METPELFLQRGLVALEEEVRPPNGLEASLIAAARRDDWSALQNRTRPLTLISMVIVGSLIAAALGLLMRGGQYSPRQALGHYISGHVSQADLSAAHKKLALRAALLEAEGANPVAPGPVIPMHGWPSYVRSISATIVRYGYALNFLDHTVSGLLASETKVLLIELDGNFAFTANYTGTHIFLIVSLADGSITDATLARRHSAVPRAMVIYGQK